LGNITSFLKFPIPRLHVVTCPELVVRLAGFTDTKGNRDVAWWLPPDGTVKGISGMHVDAREARPSRVTSLVFPAYNPGTRAERTWQAVHHFLQHAPGRWEVLFICDGCTDGTPARLDQLIKILPGPVRILAHTPRRGKGYSVRRGLEAATGQWRLFTDIDLAYSWDSVLRLAKTLWAGAEVAIASRTHADSLLTLPPKMLGYVYRRHLQSRLFTGLARALLPVRQRDTQAGLKGVSAAVARRLLPHLRCDGFGLDCEILTACAYNGIPVTEVPVCLNYEDAASTTSVQAVGRMMWELLRIRRVWRGPLPPVEALPAPPVTRKAA
jgi:dolichyl-phosphate beta-glucosyltransferase